MYVGTLHGAIDPQTAEGYGGGGGIPTKRSTKLTTMDRMGWLACSSSSSSSAALFRIYLSKGIAVLCYFVRRYISW